MSSWTTSLLFTVCATATVGYVAYKHKQQKMATTASPKASAWQELAAEYGYEGAACIVQNKNGEILFLISTKEDGSLQAEMAGGKPEVDDKGDPKRTAIRELYEEAGIMLKPEDLTIKMETTGGTTGLPSFQFLTRPMDPTELGTFSFERKFVNAFWSKIHYSKEKRKWTIKDGIPIRRFNTFFLEQNHDNLRESVQMQ